MHVRPRTWSRAVAATCLLAGGVGLAAAKEDSTMTAPTLEHGFRYDPMQWVEKDRSLQGAMARAFVFEKPKRGDKKLIQAEIDKALAKQLPDGRLSDDKNHSYQFTAEKLIRLAEMGCPAGRREVKKALDAILAKPKPNQADPHGIYDVRAFCLLGLTDRPKFRDLARAGLRRIVAREKEWSNIWEGCPWTPVEHLITLWHGRKVAGVEPTVAKALGWIADGLNDAGCISYKDPWGFVRLASVVDHPLAKRILHKEAPMLLRAQRADGGWGDKSFIVLKALNKHGLLDKLRDREPLPPDWTIVKSIPAPAAGCSTLAWDGQRLWTRHGKANEAIAVSPHDGSVVKRLKLPVKNAVGIGWWGGSLAVTQRKPKKLLKVNPDTGKVERAIDLKKMDEVLGVTQVDGKLVVGDGFMCNVSIIDPAKPGKAEGRVLGGPGPFDLATEGDAVWHVDFWAPALIKSSLAKHGQLLDWGEKPFDGRCDGLAFDGKRLWALDNKNQRICALERTSSARGKRPKAAAKRAAAPSKASVKREANKVCIEGVPTLGWGKNSDTTFAGALEAALSVTRHPYTTTQIMGYSGLAFRVRWGPRDKGWCPSCPVGEFPEEKAAVGKATGWTFRDIDEMANESDPKMARYADDMARSIDAGLPVVGYPKVGDLNVGVAYGYEGSGKDRTFLWRSYWSGAKPNRVPAAKTGPWVLLLTAHTRPPSDRGRLLESLRIAVRNWRRQPADTTKKYYYLWGEQALRVWHHDLRDAGRFTDEQRKGLLFANWWCYSILADARGRAAQFLDDNAKALAGEAREAVERAAAIYAQEARLLAKPFKTKDAFFGPWSGKQSEDWTQAVRKREQHVLAEALRLETQAIAELEKALVALAQAKP